MVTQYNIAIKVLDKTQEWRIQHVLQGYACFTDGSGNLKDTCFSREQLPYVGEVVVLKTLNQGAANLGYRVLGSLESMLVHPVVECDWEEDQKRVAALRTQPK